MNLPNDNHSKSILEQIRREFVNAPQRPLSAPGLAVLRPSTKPTLLRRLRVSKPKVFVSFDYDNDRHYKRLLEAWSANAKFQFTFHDITPLEVMTNDVSRVKAVLTTKIQAAQYTLVLVGRHANQPHKDQSRIGCINWIHFEIQQSIAYKKKLVVVLLEPSNKLPTNIINQPGTLVSSFNEDEIVKALTNE